MLGIYRRMIDRARWEWREWHRPSAPTFLQEELDRALLDEIDWPKGTRVLDVGCAHGDYLTAIGLRGAVAVGVDVGLPALRRAKAAGRSVVAGSGLCLPFADGAFDTIVCHKTLHLFDRPEAIVQEFNRILRPGGRVVFSSSNPTAPYARFKRAAVRNGRNANWGSANAWSVAQWCRAFAGQGLRTRAIFSCNLVWPLVFRVCDRWVIPNEWMRRYNRWIRRVSRLPMRTAHPHGAALDYVVELAKDQQFIAK